MSKKRRYPLRPDFHKPGTLLQVFTDGLGLRDTPSSEELKWENVWLKTSDILMFLLDGNQQEPVENPYVKCLSRHGIVWVHPNTLTVLLAMFPPDLPDRPEFFDPESSWV